MEVKDVGLYYKSHSCTLLVGSLSLSPPLAPFPSLSVSLLQLLNFIIVLFAPLLGLIPIAGNTLV